MRADRADWDFTGRGSRGSGLLARDADHRIGLTRADHRGKSDPVIRNSVDARSRLRLSREGGHADLYAWTRDLAAFF